MTIFIAHMSPMVSFNAESFCQQKKVTAHFYSLSLSLALLLQWRPLLVKASTSDNICSVLTVENLVACLQTVFRMIALFQGYPKEGDHLMLKFALHHMDMYVLQIGQLSNILDRTRIDADGRYPCSKIMPSG